MSAAVQRPATSLAGGDRGASCAPRLAPAPLAALKITRRAATAARRGAVRCRAEAGTTSLTPSQLQSAAAAGDSSVHWARATVVENREASADGSARTLLLSVEDAVTFLDGRRMRHIQTNRRWIDEYRVPGQFVAVRYCAASSSASSLDDCADVRVAGRLQCLASSPYEARRDSALLDASLVELLVSRGGDADERRLAELGPGAQVDVSRVAGGGFASLFNPGVNLMASLESGHPLLVLAAGTRGIAPVRAALSWTPVLAHAGSSRVAVFQLAPSQAAAPYLLEWDTWREAGVQVHPLYLEEAGGGAGPQAAEQLLEQAVFGGEHGLAGVLGGAAARDAAVLMSGLEGEAAAGITRALVHHGIPSERVMVCEY